MERKLRLAPILCKLLAAILASSTASADETRTPLPQVKAADLHDGRATIIGYLGKPLGTVVTVRGVWYAPAITAKVAAPIYRVTHINGEAISPPIDLTHYRVRAVVQSGRSGEKDKERWDWRAKWGGTLKPPDFKAGEEWEFSGVETIATSVPIPVWEESGPVAAEPPDSGANGFLSTFEFISARRIDGDKNAPQQTSPPRAK